MIDAEGAAEMGMRSRGTPRIANRLLKRVRDYAQVKYDGRITNRVAAEALDLLEVDQSAARRSGCRNSNAAKPCGMERWHERQGTIPDRCPDEGAVSKPDAGIVRTNRRHHG